MSPALLLVLMRCQFPSYLAVIKIIFQSFILIHRIITLLNVADVHNRSWQARVLLVHQVLRVLRVVRVH
jgi:hypothetical protein